MISDVLSDAVVDIDRYLNDSFYDQVYEGETREKIVSLRESMIKVRILLDSDSQEDENFLAIPE